MSSTARKHAIAQALNKPRVQRSWLTVTNQNIFIDFIDIAIMSVHPSVRP